MFGRGPIPYKYAVALTVALGLFMVVLDSTIVNVALSTMVEEFDTTINAIQWVVTAYTLAQAAVIPAAGYLGTRFGLKRLYIAALAVFAVGSVLCGLSPVFVGAGGGAAGGGAGGEGWLIAFRIVQGLGGGMLFPLGTALAFGAFPPEERAASSAVIAVPVLLAPAFGPTVGGLIVDSDWGWPGIFFINGPIGVVALFLLWRILRPDHPTTGRAQVGFDVPGLLLSMVGAVLVVYAFVVVSQTRAGSETALNPEGVVNGWGYPPVWWLLAAGVVALLLFAVWELRAARDPVLDLRLFRARDFTVASVVTWVTRAAVFGAFLVVPLFLQQFQGRGATETGLILMGQGLGAIVGIQSGSRLYDRIGPRALVVAGMVLLTASTWLLAGVGPESGWSFFAPILFLRGVGFGWTNLPIQTVALQAITGPALAKASSLYNATAQVFTSVGIAVVSTLLVERTAGEAARLAAAPDAATRSPADLLLLAGTAATGDVFRTLAVVTAAAIVVCFFLPKESLKQRLDHDAASAVDPTDRSPEPGSGSGSGS